MLNPHPLNLLISLKSTLLSEPSTGKHNEKSLAQKGNPLHFSLFRVTRKSSAYRALFMAVGTTLIYGVIIQTIGLVWQLLQPQVLRFNFNFSIMFLLLQSVRSYAIIGVKTQMFGYA